MKKGADQTRRKSKSPRDQPKLLGVRVLSLLCSFGHMGYMRVYVWHFVSPYVEGCARYRKVRSADEKCRRHLKKLEASEVETGQASVFYV